MKGDTDMKRILVGLAGTEYTDVAIERAVELAKHHEAELTGVTVFDPSNRAFREPTPIGAGAVVAEVRQQRQQVSQMRLDLAVERFTHLCRAADVSHRIEHEHGDAFRLMVSYSRYHDLTIFGLRSIFEFFFEEQDSSDILQKLIRGGVRPIVAVSKTFRPIRKVLIGYSGSVESSKAMRRFVQMRLWPGVEIKIVTFEGAREDPNDLLRAAGDYCRAHGYEPATEKLPGAAKTGLLAHAREIDADLIVLGNSARSLIAKKVFGDTALNVLREADRPLFLAQ